MLLTVVKLAFVSFYTTTVLPAFKFIMSDLR